MKSDVIHIESNGTGIEEALKQTEAVAVFKSLPEKEAMAEAEELVYEFVRAGFTKIHLDTSMKLADDPEGALSPYVVARRGARRSRGS